MREIINSKKGFSLIETFVAISILMIAVLGPMMLIGKFFSDNNFAKNQMSASFLAQEGVELATNIISTYTDMERKNMGNGDECNTARYWLDGVRKCSDGPSSYCGIDAYNNAVVDCLSDNSSRCWLYFAPTSSGGPVFYLNGSKNSASVFRRKIHIDTLPLSESQIGTVLPDDFNGLRRAKIISTVTWLNHGVESSVAAESIISEPLCPS